MAKQCQFECDIPHRDEFYTQKKIGMTKMLYFYPIVSCKFPQTVFRDHRFQVNF